MKNKENIGRLAVGICLGLLFGFTFNNIPLGLSLGLVFGLIFNDSTKKK